MRTNAYRWPSWSWGRTCCCSGVSGRKSKSDAAEERLRESEALYRSLIETSTDGATISKDGIFDYVSPAFERILGYPAEELIGQPFLPLIHLDDREIVTREIALQIAEPERVSLIEARVRHRDGSWLVIEASGKRLPDGRIFSFSRDVTQRKQIEDALITIINDILDFSKIEAGRLDLDQQPLDLRMCVEAALDVVAHRAAEKGLDLAAQIDAGTPAAIVADAVRLRQILVNLLANAVKFTEQGEVVISVSSEFSVLSSELDAQDATTRNLCELHFSVRDTGIGILPERIDRLFQSFSQIDPSTTRQYGGTRLGLVISKRLTELMGGRMWVESAPGQGSTFHFTIQAQAAPSAPPVYLRGEQPQLRGKHVLVVDDNPTNRTIVCHQVASWGMTCDMAASGAEALALLRDGQAFDLAILDLDMPAMDGIAACRRIKAIPQLHDIPKPKGIAFTSLAVIRLC